MDAVLIQISRAVLVVFVELVTTPVWWYTGGFRRVLRWASRVLRGWEHVVGLRLWARNLFAPMYGQTDIQGRLISFGMRLVVLVGRIFQVILGAVGVLVALLAYLVLPLALIVQIVRAFVT